MGTHCALPYHTLAKSYNTWLSYNLVIFLVHLKGNISRFVLRVKEIEFWEDIGQSMALPMHVLDFRYVASFRNQSTSKATESKTEAKFRTLHSCKN